MARWAQQWNAIGRDVSEITCSVNVRTDQDGGLEAVLAAVAGYRDAGADLVILNLPHHAKPGSLQPLAETLAPLTGISGGSPGV